MNAADIAEQIAAIEVDAKRRGVKVAFVNIGIATFQRHNVRAYISNLGGADIGADGDDFADALVQLRTALADYMPDEERLASILGYTEIRHAAE